MNAPVLMNDIDAKTAVLLGSMRAASLRYKGLASEIDTLGVALKGGMIDLEETCLHLNDIGVLAWLPHPDAPIENYDEPVCDTCGASPCINSSFCKTCRAADKKRGRR